MGTAIDKTKMVLDKLGLHDVNPGACAGGDQGWIDSGSEGQEIVSFNPSTGERIGSIISASDGAYEKTIDSAQQGFAKWRGIPAPKRGLVVRDLGQALREVHEPLGELVAMEMGKIKAEGLGEVQEMIDICDFAVGLSRQLYGLTMHSERPGHRMYEQWHPLGPIGIISAFNFPVAVWSWNAALAAVCGDTMIWKPSELTPLTAVAVQAACNKVAADHAAEGVFNLAIGTGDHIGERMINDRRLPLISFTGSVKTGRHVAQTVGARLGRSLLELGGNNAIIVTERADLDLAVRAVLFGAVGTAGQRCTTTRRLILHRSIAAEMTTRLIEAYGQVQIGDPTDSSTLMGPLVSERSVEGMMQALVRAKAEGGEVLCGGKPLPHLGPCFVEPTLVRMPSQSPLVCEETFAPVLYLLEYDSLEQAVEMHNDVPQGLSSAIFTRDLLQAEQFLSAAGSDCGIANVNIGTSGAEIGGAFGGEKDTGGGRESGSDAWRAYMRRQTNTINYSSELPLAQGISFGAD